MKKIIKLHENFKISDVDYCILPMQRGVMVYYWIITMDLKVRQFEFSNN